MDRKSKKRSVDEAGLAQDTGDTASSKAARKAQRKAARKAAKAQRKAANAAAAAAPAPPAPAAAAAAPGRPRTRSVDAAEKQVAEQTTAERKAARKAARAAKRAAKEAAKAKAAEEERKAAVSQVLAGQRRRTRSLDGAVEMAAGDAAAPAASAASGGGAGGGAGAQSAAEAKAARKAAKAARKAAKKRAKELAASGASTGGGASSSSSSSSSSGGDGKVFTAPTGRRCFYVEHPAVTSRAAADVASFRDKHQIAVLGNGADQFKPVQHFVEASKAMPADVMKAVAGFSEPTPIQAQCWPVALTGRDCVGVAATGSGKTIAFTLPGLMHVRDAESDRRAAGQGSSSRGAIRPLMLVVAPTRELAVQSAKVAAETGKCASLRSVVLYGGMPKYVQNKQLRANGGAHIVVATPGRLLDMIEDNSLTLADVSYLVLDEADRMLDMGFERDMRRIIGMCKQAPIRQTLMFTATWPDSIHKIASEFLTDPIQVNVGSVDLSASRSVKQTVEVIEDRDRERRLRQLLNKYHKNNNRVLVFVLYKKEATRMENTIRRWGYIVGGIHGDKTQDQRNTALQNFRDGSVPLLVATDVAARGLDIPDVEVVLNYSFPLTTEDYVHRIGRTGRGGKSGISHTFFTQVNKPRAGELVNVLREAGEEVPKALLKFGVYVKRKEHSMYGAFDGRNRGSINAAKKVHMKFD